MQIFTDQEIQTFVDRETGTWQPLPDKAFLDVPDYIAAAAKQGDRNQLDISRNDLLAVMRQRRDKGSFAYQYKLWITDCTATKLDFIRNSRGETQEIQAAMLNVVMNGLLYKLTAMERWYHTVFTDTPAGESPDQEMLDAAKAYESPNAPADLIDCVEAIFSFKQPFSTPQESAAGLKAIGLTIDDVRADNDLLLEAGIAHNVRVACKALGVSLTPHQSFSIAKTLASGKDRHRNGVPLTDHERSIAILLWRSHFKAQCEQSGEPFTAEIEKDCERIVRSSERGMTVGHKIGEASGCFQVLILAAFLIYTVAALAC